MPAAARRIYATVSPELEEAVREAPNAALVADGASDAEALRAWALYGYRAWQVARERETKLAAYAELAADEERRASVREANRRAAAAGLL